MCVESSKGEDAEEDSEEVEDGAEERLRLRDLGSEVGVRSVVVVVVADGFGYAEVVSVRCWEEEDEEGEDVERRVEDRSVGAISSFYRDNISKLEENDMCF